MKAKRPLKRTYLGSDFREFLNELGILGEVETMALKQAVRLKFERRADVAQLAVRPAVVVFRR